VISGWSRGMAAFIAAAAVVAGIGASSGAAATPARKTIDRAPKAATASRDRGAAHGSLDFSVALKWRHRQALAALDRAVSDPSSPDYGRYLTPAQFRRRFSPTGADVAAVTGFLRSHGFRVGNVSKARMLVEASGSVRQAERAFHTDLRRYAIGGHRLIESAKPVSVPASLGSTVLGVDGLNQALAHPLAMRQAPPAPVFLQPKPCSKWWAQHYATSQPKAFGQRQPWIVCGYAGAQIQGAYGVSGAIGAGLDGRGQTVAIIDAFASPTIVADIQTYSQRHGLPPATVTQTIFPGCQQNCSAANQQGWYGEETLDFDAAHTIAPGAAIHYLGARDSGKGLDDALAYAVDNRVASIITNSYGFLGENVGTAAIAIGEQIHQEAVVEGIGLYFSSGDDGDERSTLGYVSADYPASSPYVTAVGGTSLGIGPSNNTRFNTGWGTFRTDKKHKQWKPAPPGAFFYGSGGGTSRLFSEPGYQLGVVPPALAGHYGGAGRVVPDISMDGDPTTGLLTGQTQTFPNGKAKYAEARYGGTSLSSPLLAGYMAIADQAAGFAHGFVNPRIYALAGTGAIADVTSPGSQLAAVRRDYVNGVNGAKGYTVSLRSINLDSSLRTTPGYDNVTGLGVPNGAALIQALK
jgi:subtilase family serine protease